MSALFGGVVKQARVTFARENTAMFNANFTALKQLVNRLTTKDLEIPPELLTASSFQRRAPVKYLEIFEHRTFTMSVFIVADQYTMPMHNHPGHGLLRVISGKARIQSYSLDRPLHRTPKNLLIAYEEAPVEYTIENECSVLTPTTCNIHEIAAVGSNPVAFFDVLSPPYESNLSADGPKKCLFYRKVDNPEDTVYRPWATSPKPSTSTEGTTINSNNQTTTDKKIYPCQVYLQEIRPPFHYFCDEVQYKAPALPFSIE